MHAAIVHLTPILAAEKSKTPFYVAGGVLVAWALIVSLGFGLRESGFPGTVAVQRLLMAVTAVLVVGAVATGIATSGGSTKEAQAAGAAPSSATSSGSAAGSSTAATGSAAGSSAAATGSAAGSSAATGGAQAGGGAAQSGAGSQPGAGQPPNASEGTKLSQAADPSGQLRFAKSNLTAKAGKVSIEFTNRSPLSHNLTIASGSTVLGATPTFSGGTKTLTLNLKPGTYKFYCSVPGHREAGMEGTLVVR